MNKIQRMLLGIIAFGMGVIASVKLNSFPLLFLGLVIGIVLYMFLKDKEESAPEYEIEVDDDELKEEQTPLGPVEAIAQ